MVASAAYQAVGGSVDLCEEKRRPVSAREAVAGGDGNGTWETIVGGNIQQ